VQRKRNKWRTFFIRVAKIQVNFHYCGDVIGRRGQGDSGRKAKEGGQMPWECEKGEKESRPGIGWFFRGVQFCVVLSGARQKEYTLT